MFTYSKHCVLIVAFFSCAAGDSTPTSDAIRLLEEFNITDYSVALPHTIHGRSVASRKLKFGIYPQHVTWFDANATCAAEGYESLIHGHNNMRTSMAYSRILVYQGNFVNFDYWSGFVRLDPCNATWGRSNCDPVQYEGIYSTNVTANLKQCATSNYNGSRAPDEHIGRFCSELHPFICKMVLGNVTFTKLNDSLVPISKISLLSGNISVSVIDSTSVPQCMTRCSRSRRCIAFTFQYDKNMCWRQTSETPEVVYQLFQVGVNVSSYVKDGYQYEINNNSTIQNASQVFRCLNGSIYNYTLTSSNDMKCSESTEDGDSVESSDMTLSPGLPNLQTSTQMSSSSSQTCTQMSSSSSQTSTQMSSSSSQTSTQMSSSSSQTSTQMSGSSSQTSTQMSTSSSVTFSIPSMTSVSNPSTTSTRPSSIVQTQGRLSIPQQSSATSLPSPEPHALCKCPCSSFYEIHNLNQAATSTDIEEEIRRSEVPKRKTGKFQRKLQSATDNRPSSVQIGAVSIAVIVCVFGSVTVLDILKLFKHFTGYR